MRPIAIVLMSVICVGIATKPVSGGIEDPPKAQRANVEVKHDLILRKISRDPDSPVIKLEVLATGIENEWVWWSDGPRITTMTDETGKVIYEPERPEAHAGEWVLARADWETKGHGQRFLERTVKTDRAKGLKELEAVAEVTLAKDLEYFDLGELKGLDRKIEIATGETLHLKSFVKETSCAFLGELEPTLQNPATKILVGIETFDVRGKVSGEWGWTTQGFSGVRIYHDGSLPAKTGRLVIANRVERVPLKLTARDLMIAIEPASPRKPEEARTPIKVKEPEGTETKLSLVRAAEKDDDVVFETALAAAVKENSLGKIEPRRKLTIGTEAMIAACGTGKIARVQKLIELGVVPTGEANESGNVLTEAARSGSVELVRLLLDKGVDVNAPGRARGNAIFWAAGPKWSPELLQLLASKGADVKIAIPRSGRPTVISNALASGDEALVKEVLRLGAPISVRIDSRVHDVLGDAIFRRDVRAVQILLRVGVKPGNCEGAIGPSGNVSNHLDLARQMVGSVDSAQTREILKMIEEAGK